MCNSFPFLHVVVADFMFIKLCINDRHTCIILCISNSVCKLNVSTLLMFVFLSIVLCSYHLRSPLCESTGVVSIGPWVEKGSPNYTIKLMRLMCSNDGHYT